MYKTRIRLMGPMFLLALIFLSLVCSCTPAGEPPDVVSKSTGSEGIVEEPTEIEEAATVADPTDLVPATEEPSTPPQIPLFLPNQVIVSGPKWQVDKIINDGTILESIDGEWYVEIGYNTQVLGINTIKAVRQE